MSHMEQGEVVLLSFEFEPLDINEVTASWCFGGRQFGCPLGDVLDLFSGYQLARATRTPHKQSNP